MPNPYGVPEVSVQLVADRLKNEDVFVLLDVREPHELQMASLGAKAENAPLSDLSRLGTDMLPLSVIDDKSADVVVFCHHGARSAQVVAWLRQQGWENVVNMDGGIDAYAIQIDKSVGRY